MSVATLDAPQTAAEQLRAGAVANQGIGIDRAHGIVKGYVVAESGNFKSKGRGAFDDKSLQQIVSLMAANPAGTPSRLQHPSLIDDRVLQILGRLKNPRIGTVRRRTAPRQMLSARTCTSRQRHLMYLLAVASRWAFI